MRLFVVFMMVVSVLASVIPESGTKQGIADAANVSNDEYSVSLLESLLDNEQHDILQTVTDTLHSKLNNQQRLQARSLETTIEGAIRLLNSSGIIWSTLDYAVDHPRLIELVGNTTANIINGASDSSLLSKILGFAINAVKDVNASALILLVEKSGLVTSVLDGLLLDDSFRPNISRIIYQAVESNLAIITLIGRDILKPQNSKRFIDEDNYLSVRKDGTSSGGLFSFIGNLVGGLLNSQFVYDGLNDTLVALNDTGFVVYTLQRFLSNSAYVNATGDLIKDVIKNTHVTLNLNVTKIVESALANPTELTSLVGDLLSGNAPNVVGGLKRYVPGIKAIIKDLENMGMFVDLNHALFPQNSDLNKDAVNERSVSKVLDSSASGKGLNWLVMIHALMISVFFLG